MELKKLLRVNELSRKFKIYLVAFLGHTDATQATYKMVVEVTQMFLLYTQLLYRQKSAYIYLLRSFSFLSN